MDLLLGIAEKSASALAASGLSLLGLRLLRPRIKISPEISAWWSEEKQGIRYSIKIVNKTRRALVEPRFELTLFYPNSQGRTKSMLIHRGRPDPMSISGRKKRKSDGKQLGVYTIAYGGDDADLLALAGNRTRGQADKASFRFRCFVRDGFSGIGRQFEMTYELPARTIVFGTFEQKGSVKITPSESVQAWQDKVAAAFGGSNPTAGEEAPVPSARSEGEAPLPPSDDHGTQAGDGERAAR